MEAGNKKIDKAAWQETLAHYRAWNEAEFREKIKNAGKKTPLQKWREFLAIMEFGLKIKPQPSMHEHQQKIEMLNQYYERMQNFEMRRTHPGKSV
jgi:hypothetical protein